MAELGPLLDEARALGLFRAHGASTVHCSHCHARLDARGDCGTCGLIGRSDGEIERRAASDEGGMATFLAAMVAKRKAFRPAKAGPAREG